MRVPVVLQGEAADCGLACVSMISGFYEIPVTVHDLRGAYGSSAQGVSLYEIHEILADRGFTIRALEGGFGDLANVMVPAIAHWSGNHFVILERVTASEITIVDPGIGRTTLSLKHAEQYFSGFVLEVLAAPSRDGGTYKSDGGASLSIWELVISNRSMWPLMAMVGLGSMAVQLLSLSLPYLVSLVIDKAVTPRDTDTLKLITFVFAGFFGAKVLLLFINARLQSNLTLSINSAVFSSVTRHLYSLPYRFFLMRSAADTHARVRTLEAVHIFFSSGLFEAPFSLMFAFLAMGVLFYLQPMIAFVALAFILVTLLVEVPAQLFLEARQKRRVIAEIDESKVLVSSMLRIDHIKLNNSERLELSEVLDSQRRRIDATRDLDISQRDIQGIVESLSLIQKLVMVFLLAAGAIDGSITVGLAVAFLMFTDEIKFRLLSLVQTWSAWRTTRVQLDRVAEIVSEKSEFDRMSSLTLEARQTPVPEIELSDIGFSYSRFGEMVLTGVNLQVAAGDKIAIRGPSGSGKSTLLRMIATLIRPTQGVLRLNGAECDDKHLIALRKNCGGFFAEDRLIDGTVKSNITRDAAAWDDTYLNQILEVTRLNVDLEKLESGLNTLISGDGRGLSSGQSQRILLARALMRKPRVLLLDEPTSHCDPMATESIVNYLAKYDGTVIVSTHEPMFSARFGRTVWMHEGELQINQVNGA